MSMREGKMLLHIASLRRHVIKSTNSINQIEGTLLDLFIDSSDVLSDNSQTDELDTTHEQHRNDDRCPALHYPSCKQLEPDRIHEVSEASDGDSQSEVRCHLKREKRKGENAIQCKPYHFCKRILGHSSIPRVSSIAD